MARVVPIRFKIVGISNYWNYVANSFFAYRFFGLRFGSLSGVELHEIRCKTPVTSLESAERSKSHLFRQAIIHVKVMAAKIREPIRLRRVRMSGRLIRQDQQTRYWLEIFHEVSHGSNPEDR